VIALGVTVGVILFPALGWSAGAPTPSYAVGQKIDVSASLYERTARTVLLFARSSCQACQRSKLAMAALVHDLTEDPGVAVVLVTPGNMADIDRVFGRELGIEDARIVSAATGTLRIRHVPAIVVVDNTGRILLTREGVLTEADRRDVTQVAGGLSPPDARAQR